jgi:class 3 adenylate cyclase/predicted metal-dependent HD superfamily phosphohydrolase
MYKIDFHLLIIIFLSLSIIFILFFLIRNSIKHFKRKLLDRIREEVRQEIEKEMNVKQVSVMHNSNEISISEDKVMHQTYSKKYEQATVLFADIQGFTRIVEHMNPEKLIDELDRFFFHFDEVVEKYDIEKIKTIGDAYMCAGGLPQKNRTNPVEVVLAAFEMQQFMKKNPQPPNDEKTNIWDLRIGIHTGPVISGLVGRKKISFDIWGDTVNIASRMESSGIAGEVNITGVTYQYVRDFFTCQYRGKMPIKYKGETDMYFVKGIIPELSEKGEGIIPNPDFFIRLQHIRFGDLEEYVLDRLKNELPQNLHYHNTSHTTDVVTRVEVIGLSEAITDEQLLLVKTAALLHDIGYLNNFVNHEKSSIELAKEILPKYRYNEQQINTITELIAVTTLNQEPKNLLEEIIKDADLDYLGRPDYIALSLNLYKELIANGVNISETDWNIKQYEFIMNHRYYTNTARRLRQVNKIKQLEKLKILSTI